MYFDYDQPWWSFAVITEHLWVMHLKLADNNYVLVSRLHIPKISARAQNFTSEKLPQCVILAHIDRYQF